MNFLYLKSSLGRQRANRNNTFLLVASPILSVRMVLTAGYRSNTVKSRRRLITPQSPLPSAELMNSTQTTDPSLSQSQTNTKVINPNTVAVTTTTTTTSLEPSTTNSEQTWNWIPPRYQSAKIRDDGDIIPVIENKLLTAQEIQEALISQGGENVVIVQLADPLAEMTEMVIATGKSERHIRKMSDSIVRALKSRKLKKVIGHQGAEGEKNDDWLAIDCHTVGVHILLKETRVALDLETYLTMKDKPTLQSHTNPKEYDKKFDELLEKYPLPENYPFDSSKSDNNDKKNKKKPNIYRL